MNKERFKILFDTYFDPVRTYIFYRVSDEDVAQDLAQDVFMQVWHKKDRLKDQNLKALLYKMASDSVVSYYRRSQVELNFSKNMYMDDTDERMPDGGMEFRELVEKYNRALSRMNDDQRTVFLMSREESMKYSEIADRLQLSIKTIEKRMSAALKILKDNILLLIIWISTM